MDVVSGPVPSEELVDGALEALLESLELDLSFLNSKFLEKRKQKKKRVKEYPVRLLHGKENLIESDFFFIIV